MPSGVDYALEFRTVVAGSRWNEPMLKTVFRQGLNANILKEMACRDDSSTLDTLIDLAIRLDNLLSHRHSALPPFRPPVQDEYTPEPMQLGRMRLSRQERERQHRENLLDSAHTISECPK